MDEPGYVLEEELAGLGWIWEADCDARRIEADSWICGWVTG